VALQKAADGLLTSGAQLYEHHIFLQNLQTLHSLPDLPRSSLYAEEDGLPDIYPIRVRNVTFRYSGANKDAVREVNFEIQKGMRVAVVGANGSGKSTLLKLLCLLYKPDSGEILLGNLCSKDADPGKWRRCFSVLSQDFQLFHGSLGENIAMGDAQRAVSSDTVRDAAVAASVDKFADRLPGGLRAIIGKQFRSGIELSGGERQQVALARVIYRNSPVWLLDEPNSALDIPNRDRVKAWLRERKNGRTIIYTTHSLDEAAHADLILLISDGTLFQCCNVEQATHILARSKR